MKFCHGCGKEIHETAVSCPHCGAKQSGTGTQVSTKGKLILAIVCWFLGPLGIHRFMVGKNGSAVAQLILTCTVIGLFITVIWAIIDFIMILTGNFKDKNGIAITEW
jgi:TM2 domain-containing membrane protein YozV